MKPRYQRGAQIVEFAVVLPVIILLSLMMLEGANMFRVYELVDNAAREGARLASLPQYSTGAQKASATQTCTFNSSTLTSADPICQGVGNYAQDNGLIGSSLARCGTLTVNVNQAYTAPNDSSPRYSQVRVVCAYQLRWLPRLQWYSLGNLVNISGTTAFLNLWG